MSLNYDDIVKDTDAIVRTKSEPVTRVFDSLFIANSF